MEIICLPSGFIQTNAYLLLDRARGEAALIDAPHGVWEAVEPRLRQAQCALTAMILTHGHWDHTGDAARIQAAGVPIYGHEADRVLFETPEVMAPLTPPEIPLAPCKLDYPVGDGETLTLLGRAVEIRHVPGHCPGNILCWFAEEAVAFVGDALFAGSIGRYDLPGGDFAMLAESIRERIYTLPDDTRILSGHGPGTTVGREKASNPFVRP
jgi:hydroxyacylglutathione hydrolase